MPEHAEELLKLMLPAAVPLWISELKGLPWPEITKLAAEASQYIAEHGDALMYKTKGTTAKAFNQLAKGIAALSFVPGGVKIFGLHFEARHEGAEAAVASNRPRDITFEQGTLGRLILMRGLRIKSTPEAVNPLLGNDPWKDMAKHFMVRIIDRDNREFITHFSMGVGHVVSPDIEHVLEAIANEALDAERAEGSVEKYADMLGYEPDDPDVERVLRDEEMRAEALRVFLGKDGYEELLTIAEEAG